MNGPHPVVEHWESLLAERMAGRRWILAFDVACAGTRNVERLRELGAPELFVLASAMGIGPKPEAPIHLLGTHGATLMKGIRAYQGALGDLPPDALAALDAFDPDGSAEVIAAIFNDHEIIAGRRVFGARAASWRRLEDKLLADDLWDAVGIPRAEVAVVPAEPAALAEAADRLATEVGTVWAGDTREGWHGAAEYTRWVHDDATRELATAFFGPRCDRVRVMPFLDGRPCSIHGIVGADGLTIALRPCEMVILRRPEVGRFHYAGSSTNWDPPDADREAMRDVARRVGAHLHRTVGYRGPFTVDGVMTADGFRPTELNPRFGGALGAIGKCLEGLDIYLVCLAITDDPDIDARLPDLEAAVIEAADAKRYAAGMAMVDEAPPEERKETCEVRGVTTTLEHGPSIAGGILRATFDAAEMPPGAAVAPFAEDAFALADGIWGTGIGTMQAAPDLR